MMNEDIKNSLLSLDEFGILRKMMSKEEIKIANILVKEGLMHKGRSDDKQHSVCYFAV